jgi:predicted helicase
LLRDEVIEQMARASPGLTGLAKDWRKLLFPQADDAQFADGYAQAVTFGLLVARARDIPLSSGIEKAADELRKSNSLIGTALRLLTEDSSNQEALKTSLRTLTRVLDAVDWHTISKDKPDAWLYFYEEFLEVYDNALRKRTGSYYTPPEVVSAMVNLVDEALRGPLFERPAGFAAPDVVVADPAVGTGTFLLGVLRRIAAIVTDDTLGNPFIEEEWLPQVYEPVAKSRRDANEVKKTQPLTVVIGNPPYDEKAKGRGGWIEKGSGGKLVAPLDRWRPPPEWGVSAHVKHLKNLYIYFWRWATWKVFGSGNYAATGNPDKDEEGIVCFITVQDSSTGPASRRCATTCGALVPKYG